MLDSLWNFPAPRCSLCFMEFWRHANVPQRHDLVGNVSDSGGPASPTLALTDSWLPSVPLSNFRRMPHVEVWPGLGPSPSSRPLPCVPRLAHSDPRWLNTHTAQWVCWQLWTRQVGIRTSIPGKDTLRTEVKDTYSYTSTAPHTRLISCSLVKHGTASVV
jgi:hypothetical protein